MSPTVPPISTMQTSALPAPMRIRYLISSVMCGITCTVAPEIIAAPLLGDHALVDASGGEIAVAAGGGAHEALVMAEIEIGLGAVRGDEHLAVLKRAHGAGIHVDVGIQLHHADLQAARLEDRTQRGGCDALAQRGNHAAGDENESSHEVTAAQSQAA